MWRASLSRREDVRVAWEQAPRFPGLRAEWLPTLCAALQAGVLAAYSGLYSVSAGMGDSWDGGQAGVAVVEEKQVARGSAFDGSVCDVQAVRHAHQHESIPGEWPMKKPLQTWLI